MTLEQILALPMGETLEYLVEELVFERPPCTCLDCRTALRLGRRRKHFAPPYSAEMCAAWSLVEELKRRHCWFILRDDEDGSDDWLASFLDHNGMWVTGRAETPTLAIVRAALKTVYPSRKEALCQAENT